jgi:hypothetical protein
MLLFLFTLSLSSPPLPLLALTFSPFVTPGLYAPTLPLPLVRITP